MAQQISLRNDISANWTSCNPLLAEGEFGIENDTQKYKIGNGIDNWNTLSYYNVSDNNFTDILLNKLNGIEEGAESNIGVEYTQVEKDKLVNIESNANNYSLPSDVVIDSTYTKTDENYTTVEKNKLSNIESNANNYSLPSASETVLGGVKVGNNLSITNGVLSAESSPTIQAKTSQEISNIPVTDNLIFWHIEKQRYLVSDPINNRFVYLGFSDEEFVPPASPGVWTESWEGSIDDIKSRWSGINNTSKGVKNGEFSFDTNNTGSSGTGPNGPQDGGWYIYTETSSNGHLTDFKLETSYFAELTEVDFHVHQYGTDIGRVSLEYKLNGNWIEVWGADGNQGNQWNNIVIDFTGTGAESIRFRHNGATSYRGDVAFDNIKITSI